MGSLFRHPGSHRMPDVSRFWRVALASYGLSSGTTPASSCFCSASPASIRTPPPTSRVCATTPCLSRSPSACSSASRSASPTSTYRDSSNVGPSRRHANTSPGSCSIRTPNAPGASDCYRNSPAFALSRADGGCQAGWPRWSATSTCRRAMFRRSSATVGSSPSRASPSPACWDTSPIHPTKRPPDCGSMRSSTPRLRSPPPGVIPMRNPFCGPCSKRLPRIAG